MNLKLAILPGDGIGPEVTRVSIAMRPISLVLVVASWFLVPVTGHAIPVTLADLTGPWDLRTVCMSNGGKPGACIEMKPTSLQFTFGPDGKWNSEANDQTHTKKTGTYEVHGNRLVLKLADGSPYQNWQADLADGGKLVVSDKKLIETFERLKSAE